VPQSGVIFSRKRLHEQTQHLRRRRRQQHRDHRALERDGHALELAAV